MLFQEELYTKQYKHLLEKAEKRQEIVNGLIRATDLIDLIIEILRGSTSVAQANVLDFCAALPVKLFFIVFQVIFNYFIQRFFVSENFFVTFDLF